MLRSIGKQSGESVEKVPKCLTIFPYARRLGYGFIRHKSVFSFMRQLTTWHCSRLQLTAVLLWIRIEKRPRLRLRRKMRQTDTVSLHRPCRMLCEQ